MLRHALPTLLGVFGCGCTAATGGGDDSGTQVSHTIDIDVLVTEQDHNPLAWTVTWSTEQETTGSLRVTCGEDYDQTFDVGSSSTSHEVFVMGLVAELECEVRVEATGVDGSTGLETLTETVSELPQNLPELTVNTRTLARMSPGWTLLNLTNEGQGRPLIVAMVDPRVKFN